MTGPEKIAADIVAELAARLPDKVLALEDRLGLPDGAIGPLGEDGTNPGEPMILAQERPRLALEEYPAIFVVVGPSTQQRVDFTEATPRDPDVVDSEGEPGHEVYRVTYRVACWLFVRGDDFADTDLRRKRYTLAIVEVLLAGLEAASVDPETVATTPSDVAQDADIGATIAGNRIEFTATVDEHLTPDPGAPGTLRHANTITPIPHPAAD